jgi:hypothetical protein
VRRSGSGDAYRVAGLGSVGREEVAFSKLCYFLNRRLEFAAVQLRHCLIRNLYLPSSPARRAGLFASTLETKSTGVLWTLTMRPGLEGRQRSAGKSRANLAS